MFGNHIRCNRCVELKKICAGSFAEARFPSRSSLLFKLRRIQGGDGEGNERFHHEANVPSFLASHSKNGSKKSSRRGSAAASSDGDSSSLFRSVLLPSFSARELEAALRRLGPVDHSSGLDLTEAELAALLAEPSPLEAENELRDAFAVFDANGDGKISAEELRSVLATLGDEACSLEDCRRMIHGVDTDGDGFVCFTDFSRMMDGQRCF